MIKKVVSFLAFPILLYLGACIYLYVDQRALLYFPTPAANVALAENLSFKSDGETLRIFRIGDNAQRAVIYFGGNAEDVSGNISAFTNEFANSSIYLVNYRGYGGSTGTPSEAALFKDAEAIYDFVHRQHPDISVIGRSLGSGVAVYLASVREMRKMVLVTPYDSMENVAQAKFPMFPISVLLKDRFDSAKRIGNVTAPTLVMLAARDEVIPRENSQALIRRFPPSQVKIAVFAGAGHNSISAADGYLKSLGTFLEERTGP